MNTTYHLDASDRIVAVDSAWIAFAAANDAADLPQRVLGRPVWQFITSLTVRELYRALFRRVRETRAGVTVTFRCDSPVVRRFMSLTVECHDDSSEALACRASLLHEEPQPSSVRSLAGLRMLGVPSGNLPRVMHGANEHLEPDVASESASASTSRHADIMAPSRRAESLLSMCSWCKRVNVSGWREIDDALVVAPSLFTEPVRPITHGICPGCAEQVRATLL